MPEPDPQPPQPRGMSFGRWLLLLLPSVPMLLTPSQIATIGYGGPSEAEWTRFQEKILIITAGAAALSFALGFQLEKWQHGAVENRFRTLCFGTAIFFVNCLVAFAGWSTFPVTIRP